MQNTPTGPVPSAARALLTPITGAAFLLRNRSLWGTVAAPLLINVVLGVALLIGYVVSLDEAFLLVRGMLEERMANPSPTALLHWPRYLFFSALQLLVPLLSTLLMLFAVGGAFLMGSKLVAAPFFDALSEQVEALHRGIQLGEEPFALGRALGDAGRAVRQQGIRIVLYVFVVGPLLLLNLLPGLGTVLYTLAAGTYTAWWLGMDLMDPPMGRRRVPFGNKVRFGRQCLPVVLAFGLSALLLASIPIVNIFATPVLVIGGTLLWLDLGGVAFHGDTPSEEQG